MAEQKSEDTTPIGGRRVARPAVGPAGAVRSGVRPVLRPVVGNRPMPGPFAPPMGAERKPSGSASETAAPPPAAASLPSHETAGRTGTPSPLGDFESLAAFNAEWAAQAVDAQTVTAQTVTSSAVDAERSPVEELSLGTAAEAPLESPASVAPVSDSASDSQDAVAPSASLLDAPAHGGESPTTSPSVFPAWLEDDYAPTSAAPATEPGAPEVSTQHVAPPVEPAPAAIDSYSSEIVETSFDWAGVSAAPTDAPTATGLDPDQTLGADEIGAGTTQEASVEAATEPWPESLLAEYAPYVATPDAVEPPVSDEAAGDVDSQVVTPEVPAEPAFASVVVAPEIPAPAPELTAFAADARASVVAPAPVADEEEAPQSAQPALGDHVSMTLDRLAARVRAGEIDVSSVAPDATEAAVLASLLAALLGGSSSR